MRLLGLACLVGLISGCGLGLQKLTSPCTSGSISTDTTACPSCAADADCHVLSNPCNAAASCVPVKGNWGVTQQGCSTQHDVPAASSCGCVSSVCQAKHAE